jgi:RNA polymerase sigma-70 factor (sigma-E family)
MRSGAGPVAWDPAFEEFAVHRSAALLRTAVFLAGDRHRGEDLLQTALLRTALNWRRARENPDAYLHRVLVNLTRDGWRLRARRPVEVPLDHDVRSAGETPVEQRDELLEALRRLPARQRAAVVLRYWEELSVAQTARMMGCSEGTVKSATSRGLDRLRVLLGESTTEPTRSAP